MARKILVIDDDLKLNNLIKDYLTQYSYQVFQASKYDEAKESLRKQKIDLIILDIMLPEINGFDICKKIRQESAVPILMLSARGETMDKVIGLELGADDYMAKPFEPRELLARIQSILRRTDESQLHSKTENNVTSVGDLQIDWNRREAFLKKKSLPLTSLEFDLLSLLFQNKGKILDRDFIIDQLHGIEWNAFDRSIDVLMSRLRQKIGDDVKKTRFIKTIWGRGYILLSEQE